MNRNKIKATPAIIAFAISLFMMACNSATADKKLEAANDTLAKNVAEVKDGVQEAKAEVQDTMAEYKTFKATAEEQIKQNEKTIAELWAKKSKESTTKAERDKYKKRIDELEKKNKELKAKLARQEDPKKRTKWQTFKEEFNHDMDELGNALKDFTVNNEKD